MRVGKQVLAAALALVWVWPAQALSSDHQPHCSLAVLADSADPYYTLAVEIATSENATLVSKIEQACALQPEYLIWVVSPSHLSDRALVDYGRAIQYRTPLALGFISGSTLNLARELWIRRLRPGIPQLVFAEGSMASGPHVPSLRVAGRALSEILNREIFVRELRHAGYVHYNGHGGAEYFRFRYDQSERFISDDIPVLPPLVFSAFSCNTFRFWQERSIALAFVDRGAAAYAGFSYSPRPGCAMDDGIPFSHTWPGFPIGRVVQIQARAAMLAVSRFPIVYMLGDPRLSLSDAPCYKIIADREQKGFRQIEYAPLPPGIVPIRIDGGAQYPVVTVPGFSHVSVYDDFYSGRLQMVNAGDDKYLLVQHPGGPLTIRLTHGDAITARAARALFKALDVGFVVYAGGDRITPMLMGVLGAFGIWVFKKRASARILVLSVIMGTVFGSAHLIYAVLRKGGLDAISNAPAWNWWSAAITLTLVTFGSILFLNLRMPWTKILAVAVAISPVAGPALLWLCVPFVFNSVMGSRIGGPLYNYALGIQYLFAAGVFGFAFAMICFVARRIGPAQRQQD